MYSRKKIQDKLEIFAAREGWMPITHSIEEVDEFNKYIESITKVESNTRYSYVSLSNSISGSKQQEIIEWIKNEQVMCCADYHYWESRYAYIKSETGQFFRFKNRRSQEIVDSIIADLDEKNLSKEFFILGSRQIGVSTKFILMGIHRALFSPNTLIQFASPMKMRDELMFQFVSTAYNRCPWWLVPRRLQKCSFDNGSSINIKSGFGLNIAQGCTPNFVYVANAENYPNPMKTFEEGLLKAVHSSSNTVMAIHANWPQESNWIRNTWNYSKAYYWNGKSRLMPVFLPWYVSSDIYPTREWITRFPVPEGFTTEEVTNKHVVRAESYVRNTPYLSNALGHDWKMPIEQQWFWQYSYNEAKYKQAIDQFLSAMPADDTNYIESNEISDEDVDLNKLFPSASETQKSIFATGIAI